MPGIFFRGHKTSDPFPFDSLPGVNAFYYIGCDMEGVIDTMVYWFSEHMPSPVAE